MKTYDVIILATLKNVPMLKIMMPYCKKNIPHKNIYIVANKDIKHEIERIEGATFVDENSVYPNLTYKSIEGICQKITDKKVRVGWYLQQFLKLAWAYKCPDSCYIVIDADTIPLNSIDFECDGKYLFTGKVEYNKPYFDTMEKLFDGKVSKKMEISFVAEHMIFNCVIVKNMLDRICQNDVLEGDCFYEKILYGIGEENITKSGFSEFETYGNYMLTYYDKLIEIRKLRTEREAVYVLGSFPSESQLEWAAKDFYVISIEVADYHRTIITTMTSLSLFRALVRFRTISSLRRKVRTLYRRITRKADFVYEDD